jgi:hypothetical protein
MLMLIDRIFRKFESLLFVSEDIVKHFLYIYGHDPLSGPQRDPGAGHPKARPSSGEPFCFVDRPWHGDGSQKIGA